MDQLLDQRVGHEAGRHRVNFMALPLPKTNSANHATLADHVTLADHATLADRATLAAHATLAMHVALV
ncbi:unannotated protein [freshwater metagenome]|uniref:Unannotated protein n=1 Tax=freshwater metagenome TaxID=449393 RepID=A0A6J7GFD8_9ZZZZ